MDAANGPTSEPSYGRYDTLFRIAAGGMAEVYAARARGEAGFEKLVALKRMLPHLSGDERFVTMFMDEGRLAANISSPHVVSTLDLGRASDGSLYLVMELVIGATLHQLVRHARRTGAQVPVAVALELIAQAARGLHDAHEASTPYGEPLQIVHRDVSPQNILVGVDGRARLTDFGVARATQRSTQTTTGEIKGKLAYFSPEQCASQELDRRSDVFSLATVAWEALTGERLFFADNPMAIFERVTRMEIPSVAALRPEVPEEVAAVIARGLTRDREARYPSAGELERALRDAARAHGLLADQATITRFVRSHGGEALAAMEARIRASHAAPEPARASAPGEPPSRSGLVVRAAAAEEAALHDARTVVRAPAADAVEAPPARRKVPLAIGIAAVVAAAGVGAWLASAERPEISATPLAAEAPREAVAETETETETQTEAQTEAAAQTGAAAETEDEPARAPRRRTASASPRPVPAAPPAAPPATAPSHAAPSPAGSAAAASRAAVVAQPPPAAPAPPERPRGSRLLSLDQFDRDLGTQ